MHPTARGCVRWAVAVSLTGAVLLAFGPDVYAGVADVAGANAEIGLGLLNLTLTLVGSLMFPLAAALVGAAVVIQALAPGGGAPDAERHPDTHAQDDDPA